MRSCYQTRFVVPAVAAAIAAIAGTASTASAQGLEMCYTQVDLGGGLFEYEFSVTPDAGWVSGMGWRWFIFGDAESTASPMADFGMDPSQFPIGPWVSLTSSGGFHNGPTFAGVLDYWIPRDGSETLTWKGDSFARVAPGELLFSTIAGTLGGALAANFQVATFGCESGCPCACNFDTTGAPGICDIFDFLAFQDAFVAGESCACDFDTTGVPGNCDIFDFLAFQDDFVSGCP